MSTSLTIERQLIRDTFRQACASGIFWIMLAVTGVCTLLCLSVRISGDVLLRDPSEQAYFLPPPTPRAVASAVVSVLASSSPREAVALLAASGKYWLAREVNPLAARQEGVETISGRISLAFGVVSFPVARERSDSVRFLELVLAGGFAGTLGLLLALVWTAGFVPTFLEPSAVSVLLAKPVPRWRLLLGKYFGVLAFVAFQVVLFVALTWLALGLRTQVWDMTYWWCIPLLVLQFAIFYSFSVLLAVLTRSTVACAFGCVLYWLLAWGINYGLAMSRVPSEHEYLPPVTHALTQAAYWMSPKPIDAGLILFNALDAQQHFEKPDIFRAWTPGMLFHLSCPSYPRSSSRGRCSPSQRMSSTPPITSGIFRWQILLRLLNSLGKEKQCKSCRNLGKVSSYHVEVPKMRGNAQGRVRSLLVLRHHQSGRAGSAFP